MLDQIIKNKTKIHTREISLATYPHTDSRVIVHGVLKDRRYINVFDVAGAVMAPGIIHHMDVKLLIKPDPLMIEDAEVQMIHVPMPECRTTLDTMEKLKGLEVKSGFSKNIYTIMGGKRGCAHLCHLITAMGQEIVHGWLTQKRKDKLPVPKDLESFSGKNYLIDSCRLWTRQGAKTKSLEQALKNSQDLK